MMIIATIDWSATAAWVQAVGTIIALFIAVILPRIEEAKARTQQRATFAGLAQAAVQRVDQLVAQARHSASPAEDLSTLRLGEITGIMARIPLEKLPPSDQKVALEITALCRRLTDYWNQRPQGSASPTVVLETARTELVRLKAELAN